MMTTKKHFNMGSVFGRVVMDTIERKPTPNSEFINFQVLVSGRHCGSVRAFCRMWKTDRIEPFLKHLEQRPQDPLFFKSFFDQYWDQSNKIFTTFSAYSWEPREGDPRAAFILKGEVDIITPVTGGQRMLMYVDRNGERGEPTDRLELWLQDEKFLDIPSAGAFVEVKGFYRQEQAEDEYGGSSGQIAAYVEQLRKL